jgi:putative endopeptidase
MISRHILGGVMAAALLVAPAASIQAQDSAAQEGGAVKQDGAAKPAFGGFGFDVSGMNRAVSPGDDFYTYANGAWDARTQIPADQWRWGAFPELAAQAERDTRDVVQAAAGNPGAAGPEKQVGDMYASYMDEAGIEAKGTSVLRADLARIAAIKSASDVAAACAWFSRSVYTMVGRKQVIAPIQIKVDADDKNPDAFAVKVDQGDLGLPDRDYYLDASNKSYVAALAAYRIHIGRMLALAGVADSDARAADVLALETAIARAMWSREQRRDVEATYNPVATGELARRFPGFDWARFLGAVKLDSRPQMIVGEPTAIAALAKLVQTTPVTTWRAYFTYGLLNARAQVLPKAFVDEDQALQKVVSGVDAAPPRWRRAVLFVSPRMLDGIGGLGEAVGQLYVAKYFPPEAKAKIDALVHNLLSAMKPRIEKLTWMAPETKVKAEQKLAAFRVKVGYPDKWIDYSSVRIARDDAYGNLDRTNAFSFDRFGAHAADPTDRSAWGMTPQTVNAYANPNWVEVVFPAAILRPPFFDPAADDAVNYGAIGAVIGHEISHHFDDQGAKYDATGRLATWWTPEDTSRFNALTAQVVAQYSAYEPMPGVHIKGGNTLGENMADLAGINMAYDAYHLSLNGKTAPVVNGFTADQRLFLGFAQVWRTKYREAGMLRSLASDEHSPGNWRVYVVRNLDPWYAAFDVKPGEKFYLAPADRVRVW